ncbi:hypothetical protein KL86DES1_20419 [uncultured Desulfovibrio sp.]|uniref:Uncharacterized protein n=1 Tax=uncultured Desulfovibrio sp. TaxID=167968 RepID=A0A212L3U7_9BACT|nr:hypothetical protein KL86DES1_20419 [uncultured Desulfovibrio sp.]
MRSYSVWRPCFTFFETVEDGRVRSCFKKRSPLAKRNSCAFPRGSLISVFFYSCLSLLQKTCCLQQDPQKAERTSLKDKTTLINSDFSLLRQKRKTLEIIPEMCFHTKKI